MATTTTELSWNITNERYDAKKEHPVDEICKVNRWEDEEKQRRIEDTLGEQLKRYNAQLVSDIVSTNLRPNWFRQGSAYVFSLLKVAREAGNKALRSSQIQAINVKLQIAGQKGVATAQDVTHLVGNKAQHATQDVKLKLQETSQDVKLKLQETSQDVKQKLQGTSQDVKQKLQETSQDVKQKLQEKLGSAQDVAQQGLGKVQGVAQHGLESIQEAAQKLKNASLKLFSKVSQAFTNLSENTNLAFAVLEEEGERVWRLSSDNEVYAILNALRVSSLLKDTAPALYRPAFEPTRKYSTRLLEENERARRSLEDITDHTSINNAKAVAGLIAAELGLNIPAAPLPPKVEIAEIPKVKTPYTAAM